MQRSIDRAGRIVQGLLTFGRKRPLRRAGPERVQLVVEDTSPGIAPELIPTIFDPSNPRR